MSSYNLQRMTRSKKLIIRDFNQGGELCAEVLCDSGVLCNFVALKCVDNNEDNQTNLLVPGCNVAGGIVCRQSDRQVGFCAA